LYLEKNDSSKQAWEKAEEEASKDSNFIDIFGNTERKGEIIFFEALPTAAPEFDVDIMNPHYPSYYTGSMEPTDTQSPVPILFPVFKAGTPFQFACIGLNKPLYQYTIKGYKLEKLFKAALQYQGVGAKTSLGYGSFDI
jgi:CRISPR-associated protein Cmr6